MVAPTSTSELAERVRLLALLEAIESNTVIRPPLGVNTEVVVVVVFTTTGPPLKATVKVETFKLEDPPLSVASINGEPTVISELKPLLMVISAAPCKNCADTTR
jgi:hypothetical protein